MMAATWQPFCSGFIVLNTHINICTDQGWQKSLLLSAAEATKEFLACLEAIGGREKQWCLSYMLSTQFTHINVWMNHVVYLEFFVVVDTNSLLYIVFLWTPTMTLLTLNLYNLSWLYE